MTLASLVLSLCSLVFDDGAFYSRPAKGYERGVVVEVPVMDIPGRDLHGKQLTLRQDAAEAWLDLLGYANGVGIELKPTFAFRTWAQQRKLWRHSRRWAAPPGYSTHQLGVSIDIDGCGRRRHKKTPLFYWLQQNAPRFGFINDVPGEPWHWTFIGTNDDEERPHEPRT